MNTSIKKGIVAYVVGAFSAPFRNRGPNRVQDILGKIDPSREGPLLEKLMYRNNPSADENSVEYPWSKKFDGGFSFRGP